MTIPDMVAYFESLEIERRFAAGELAQIDMGAGIGGRNATAHEQPNHQHSTLSIGGSKPGSSEPVALSLPPGGEN